MTDRPNVLIIGGGIIGAACALELGRRGVKVVVVDRGKIGHGCSYGNAGWLTPSLSTPLPAPGMLIQSLRWMLDPESPLHIRPSLRPTVGRWLLGFARAMNRTHFERVTPALVELSQYSLDIFRSLSRELAEPFGFRQAGLLAICVSDEGLASTKKSMEMVSRLGVAGRAMGPEEVRSFEPAIAAPVRGAVFFPEEGHLEPLAVVQAIAAAAQRAGAQFLEGVEVFDFEVTSDRILAVRTTRGTYRADLYVLAAGAWSMPLARRIGLRLPVLGGKGYAIIVDPPQRVPRVPIKVVERRIAITPRDGSLRLAGTLELVDGDESVSPRRVNAILEGSREILGLPKSLGVREVWRGLRPCTPDGVPLIGFAKGYRNLLLATGHQMLGLHTSPGTARLAADLLTDTQPAFNPHPFRADRF